MLKIKDDVPIEELEKFGFEYDIELSSDDINDIYSLRNKYQRLCFSSQNKNLFLYEDFFETNTMVLRCDILYDLIKADLVQKVGGEDE